MTGPFTITTLHERPDLSGPFWQLTDLWPRFMLEDPVGDLYFSQLGLWRDHVLVAADADGRVVARALSVPFRLDDDIGRPALPPHGWDGVIRWSWLDHLAGRRPNHVSALEITVAPEARGTGLAARLIDGMKDGARRIGAAALVAPVRPSRKHLEPGESMGAYVARTRDDGLPEDPWLRVHARAGGTIVGVCPASMTIPGSLDQWRSWAGLPFDRPGPVEVPGALVPVHVDVANDHAVYVEPNVWVRHPV